MLRTAAMMQPYLFPYLGYFQLIARSDAFVLGDDLQYVKASWINRNRILVNGQPKLVTFSLRHDDPYLSINQRWLSDDFEAHAGRLLKTLAFSYARAPHKTETLALLTRILASPERNLARFAEQSIRALCAHLEIETPIHLGSDMGLPARMDKQERVVRIAHRLGVEQYINPIGGTALYCPSYFRAQGLVLRFLRMDELSYPQFGQPFVPSLSIIDVLMFNGRSGTRALLDRFSLVEGQPHSGALQRA